MATPLTTATAAGGFRQLFEASDDPILLTDGAGRYLDANPAALALLGYTWEELTQLHVSDVSLREPSESAAEFARLKQVGTWHGNSRLRRKDGSMVRTDTRAIQVDLPEGTLYFGIFRDRSADQLTGHDLRAAEERLRLATQAAGIYGWEVDLVAQTFTWSANAAQVVDFPMPRTVDDVWKGVHPDDLTRVQMAVAQAVESGGEFTIEYRLAHRLPGDDVWLLSAGVALPGEDGNATRIVGVTQNITARKRTDDALRESEARYRTLVHAGATTVWRMSADGEQLLEAQGGVVQPYDPAQGPTGVWLGLYTHPEDQEATRVAWRHAVETRSVYDHVQRVRAIDGSYRWVQGHAVPILDEKGEVREWMGTSTDITERKHLEQLRQDVLAMASHDLRTPLAVISMRTQLLQSRKVFDEDGVRIIQEQARRMSRLVDDLSDAVRLEAGLVVMEPEVLDLLKVVDEAVSRAQVQTDRHTVHVEPSPPAVTGAWDRARLEEVLDNLLGNAIKYSPEGGEILVRVAMGEDMARLSVTDQGVGIPSEALPRLFERFHRADATGVPGLGLGLYITRMLVEAHGGRIEVVSNPGEGSTFTVQLPLMAALQGAGDPAWNMRASCPSERD